MFNRSKPSVRRARLSAPARRTAAVLIEPVERRVLMSAAVLSNGVLIVTGTAGADAITVKLQGADQDDDAAPPAEFIVTVGGRTQTFPAASVTSLVVNAGDGQDTVAVTDGTSTSGSNPDLDFSAFNADTVSVAGGAGNDDIRVDFEIFDSSTPTVARVAVDGGDGDDSVEYTGLAGAVLHGGAGDDVLAATGDVSVDMYGDDGDDYLTATGYNGGDELAHMYGGAGDDTFNTDDIDNFITVSGGDGTDTIDEFDAGEQVRGNVISLDGTAHGNIDADDTVENVTIGQSANDLTVIGNASDNVIDFSTANAGNSTLEGAGGNDRLIGPRTGTGTTLDGGAGDDTLVAGGGPTTFVGGAGTDVADYSARTDNLAVYLDGSKPSGDAADPTDTFDGTTERVYAGSGNDLIVGTAGNNALYGNAGDDTLVSNGGTDALFGGAGNDTLNARDGGATYIDGGPGTDVANVDATGDTTINVETVNKPTTAVRLTGTTFGTSGSNRNSGNTVAKATDGSLATFYDGVAANGNVVGLDLGSARVVTGIGYAPRGGFESRMVGGTFQASNAADFSTGVVTAYTISAAPAAGKLTSVAPATSAAYRYWRYVSPSGSFGDVAEFELFGPATPGRLAGTASGSAAYANGTNTFANAVDGNLSTFFDAAATSGAFVELDLGGAATVSQIAFAPRGGYASRMVGGTFQASTTADFSAGVTTVYTVQAAPASGSLTTVNVPATTARYWRYLGPTGGHANLAEFQLFGF